MARVGRPVALILCLLFAQPVWAARYAEDFETGSYWGTTNKGRTDTILLNNFYYGWHGGGSGGTWCRSDTVSYSGNYSLRIALPEITEAMLRGKGSAPVPRIRYAAGGGRPTFPEGVAGCRFYIDPHCDVGGWLKFFDMRFPPFSSTRKNAGTTTCIWEDGRDRETHLTWNVAGASCYPPEEFPTGANPYHRMHISDLPCPGWRYANITKGEWHEWKVYWKCTGDAFTGLLKIWLDGNLVYWSYGAYQLQEGAGVAVPASLTDYNWVATAVSIINFLLNSAGSIPAQSTPYIYFDDLYIDSDIGLPFIPSQLSAAPVFRQPRQQAIDFRR